MQSFGPDDFEGRTLFYPATHLLNDQPKFFRAALLFITAKSLGQKPAALMDLALAIELLHTSSLVHDDILDGDSRRRRRRAVHVKYGVETAIIAGDALISKAMQLAAQYGEGVNVEVALAAMQMCAGELLDYNIQKGVLRATLKRYMDVARLKSASLIASSCSSASAYTESKWSSELRAFGNNIGIAFQIKDDIRDYRNRKPTGKGSGACNIVDILAAEKGSGSAMERAEALNRRYVDRAIASIETIKGLAPLADYAMTVRV
jgi:geranylgeranyl pyrophosphate synthase